MNLEDKVEASRILLRPTRQQMELYLDCLICEFVYYDASVDTLGKIRSAVRTAEFMGYPVHDYYSIWDELSGNLVQYQSIQTEVLRNDRID